MDELGEFESFLNVPEKRIQRPLRNRLNTLSLTNYNDTEFFVWYCMDKVAFQELLILVEPRLPDFNKSTNRPLNTVQQLSLAIRSFSAGEFQRSTGDILQIHQSTVSKYLPIVTNAIASLAPDVNRFPSLSRDTQSYFLD